MPTKRAVISVVIDPKLLDELDAARGKTARSAVVCELVREWLDQRKDKS